MKSLCEGCVYYKDTIVGNGARSAPGIPFCLHLNEYIINEEDMNCFRLKKLRKMKNQSYKSCTGEAKTTDVEKNEKVQNKNIIIFFIGDLVKLKHIEGPFMLVEDLDGNKVTTCWFEGCVLHRGTFNVRNLENYSDT